jgi:cytidylate kinase
MDLDLLRFRLAVWLCNWGPTQRLGVWLMTKEEAAEMERVVVREIIELCKEIKEREKEEGS